jgi:uncharacterized membrane protein YagU involved in acid resistance
MIAVEESRNLIGLRVGRGILAGLAATLVLWILKLSKEWVPQLETIRFLDHVAEASSKATGLPDPLTSGWLWHLVIGTLIWGTMFGVMVPVLPGRQYWVKGMAFGVIAGILTMLMVMPLAGAGYFGMELTFADPLISLFYHIIYGLTLGMVYAVLVRRSTRIS